MTELSVLDYKDLRGCLVAGFEG